ncbi:GMC family oxidoreductase [Serratia fonticola]|uniref:GMC family oxidoreductase n=1 Tax=Serratia fonticola TaxID=47917 RepID=UPI000742F6F5|nr:GMC family oxidoreductase [Serratia fonticola]ALX94756.1 GMC family oxidoreductase [Serratia fonticola]MBC3249167.1 GMC family oxidoreductase [Serratia fonticola]MBP1034897.1 GMC family oxidoreductase [Serratia fonticola]OIX95993.1 GMC family oxidoreductase [Serratia fonticola]PAA98438.1 GMC family oxidoreductase [Serratia fonticola]
MSTIKKPPVDVVIVGFGWTGAIMGMELTETGLSVLALERGEQRDTYPDFAYPRIADELTYGIRLKLEQEMAHETVTVRHTPADFAVPYRQLGSFLPGNGVGGAGVHWNGMHWRALPADLKMRTTVTEKYGDKWVPEGMLLQDYPLSYTELEPYFDKFEKVCGTAGKAGNLQGNIIKGGNPFEGPRTSEYPTAPLKQLYSGSLFGKAAESLGYHPFSIPAANCSEPYTNPYGVQLGPCNYCGYCERFGCFMYSKASPQTTILPVLMKRKNFELRTQSQVIKVNLDSSGKKATGVTYVDAQGQQIEQPADLVILSAFQLHNVRLLLLSGIGKPYDPVTGEGVVGKNYAYQMNSGISLFYDKDTHFNPFIGAGAAGTVIDDLNSENFDHGALGFIGGAYISATRTGGRPIQQMSLPPGTPTWGSGWKQGIKDNYQHSMSIGSEGSVMPYRDCYLDLDPTYRDAYGLPLLRMTFDWKANEIKMTQHITSKMANIAKAMEPKQMAISVMGSGSHYDVRPYQSTHTTGGAITGDNPKTSVVNKYLQCWDVPNVFVTGACAFPQNLAYNPTGIVGALAYYSAEAIRKQYLNNPGPLVQA